MNASEAVVRTPLVRAVEARLDQPFQYLRPTLDAFVSGYAATGWIVLSDYVVRQQGRATSAAAFTLMPAMDFNSVFGTAEKTARCDFKNSDRISDEMCDFITSPLFLRSALPFATIRSVRYLQSKCVTCWMLRLSVWRLSISVVSVQSFSN